MPTPSPLPTTAQILANLPPETQRVQVVDAGGKTRWRKVGEMRSSDTIVLKADGTATIMNTAPGRPGKLDLQPASEEVGEVRRQKQEALRSDKLSRQLLADPNVSPLPEIMSELALEVTSLRLEREEAERKGEDTTMISTRRIKGLQALGDIWVKRAERTATIDLNSDQFQLLFKFILDTFRSVLEDAGLRPEQVETIFTRLGKKLDDPSWPAEARAKMQGR